MRLLIAALSLVFAVAAHAQDKDKKDAKKPSAAQKEQQARMKDCNKEASSKKMKGDERKKFMSECLKDDAPSPAQKKQQARMTDCNKQASSKKMKGDERKAFMSKCLKD
jgi:hypothetical protein